MCTHSATPTQYRCTMHVPTKWNDGSAVSDVYMDNLAQHLTNTFGAVTVSPPYIGLWQDPATGKVYSDPQRLLSVDVATLQDCNTFRVIAANVKDELAQVCVYVTVTPISTYLV